MSRLDKLKRLKDEISRLFHEGLDENAIFDQLRTNERFADASRRQVQSFYSHLQEKRNVEAENERQIAEKDQQIEEHQQQVAAHQRMKTELESVFKYQQKSNNFLIYEEASVNRVLFKNFWQGRFLVTVEIGNTIGDFYTIKVKDLFQDTTKSFTVPKVGDLYGIYALKFPFVLFHEYDIINPITYLRLLKFDFEAEALEVVQSFEYSGDCQVLASASNASKFLLRKEGTINECNLIDDQIQIGKKLALTTKFNIHRGSYFDKQFCILQFERLWNDQLRTLRLIQVKMMLYDLERNEHLTRDLDSTPVNLNCSYPFDPNYSAWIRDTFFVMVQFPLTRKYGIIFTSSQLRNWKVIEFAYDLQITYIQSFADGTLMICSEGREQRKRRIYKMQMRKPDFLRNMAWIITVKLLKEAKINNPYEEARKYLPLNSEIQPFVFTED